MSLILLYHFIEYSTTNSITLACYTWTAPQIFLLIYKLEPFSLSLSFFSFLSYWNEYGSFILGNTTSLERSKTLRRPRPIAWYRSVPLGLSEIARQTKAMSAMGRRGMYIRKRSRLQCALLLTCAKHKGGIYCGENGPREQGIQAVITGIWYIGRSPTTRARV